jgi:predicted nucleic-acid-binding protein
MISVDTNILVRYLTRDDPEQAARAHRLFQTGGITVSTTVMLEMEWVLRSVYRYSREQIADAIETIILNEAVEVEAPHRLVAAVQALRAGMDFADAIHLAGCPTPHFATFDTDLARRARLAFPKPEVITP